MSLIQTLDLSCLNIPVQCSAVLPLAFSSFYCSLRRLHHCGQVNLCALFVPGRLDAFVVNAICAIMNDINTEHNMKSMCRAAVAQWTKRLTRNRYTRVQNLERRKYSFITYCLYIVAN